MKKIFVMMMAILMVFCMVACGGSAEGADTAIAKTATFEIKNIEVYKARGYLTKIAFGLYCDELDKAIVIYDTPLADYIDFYSQYSEGDIIKVSWKENDVGTISENSLVFEKVDNNLIPIEDVGEPQLARSSSIETSGILIFQQLAQLLL